MGASKKNDIASVFLFGMLLVALGAAFVALWKPLRASTLKGKLVGIAGIFCLVIAVAIWTEPGVLPAAASKFMPEHWVPAIAENRLAAMSIFSVLFLSLYLTGSSMKRPVEPCGARLVAVLRENAPDRVDRVVRSIGEAIAEWRLEGRAQVEPIAQEVGSLLSEAGVNTFPHICEVVLTELTREAFEQTLSDAKKDGVITREEREHLISFSNAFPDLIPHNSVEELLRSAEAMCALASGRLPVVDTAGLLMKYKGEKCHFVARDVELDVEQTESMGYRGGSLGTTVRVGGLPIRVGVHGGKVQKRTAIGRVDTGTLYVTSRRLVFVGTAKSTTVPINKIVQVDAARDAPVLTVVVEGARSKNLFFCTGKAAILAAGIQAIAAGNA
jgi:hypothetical protein